MASYWRISALLPPLLQFPARRWVCRRTGPSQQSGDSSGDISISRGLGISAGAGIVTPAVYKHRQMEKTNPPKMGNGQKEGLSARFFYTFSSYITRNGSLFPAPYLAYLRKKGEGFLWIMDISGYPVQTKMSNGSVLRCAKEGSPKNDCL